MKWIMGVAFLLSQTSLWAHSASVQAVAHAQVVPRSQTWSLQGSGAILKSADAPAQEVPRLVTPTYLEKERLPVIIF